MEENNERWMNCLTFKKNRCPNRTLAEKAFLLSEKQPGKDFDVLTLKEMEEAMSYCRESKEYQADTFS